MQSGAVSNTSNSMKRTAAAALYNESGTHSNNYSHGNKYNSSDGHSSNDTKNQSLSPSPPEKRSFIVVESPLKLDTIDSAEDLDLKVLQIQNKNLSERVIQRKRLEEELREKIDALENRKLRDDNRLCTMDRYWTQLDEDLRLILERFDSENSDKKASSPAVRNFLLKLNDMDKIEMEDILKDRIKFTTQTVSKIVTNYDKITKRQEQYFRDLSQSSSENSKVKIQEVCSENNRLNELISKVQQKIHVTGLEKKQFEDQINKLESEIKQLQAKNDSTEYNLDKFQDKAFKLDRQLADTIVKLNNLQKKQIEFANLNTISSQGQSSEKNHQNSLNNNSNSSTNRSDSKTDKQVSEIETDLEEFKELSSSRLHELEKLNSQFQNSLKQIEKLKIDLKEAVPLSNVSDSSEYKLLVVKYSVMVSDNTKLKASLEEVKGLLEVARLTFQRQLESMESDELHQQKRLGNEMMQLEETLTQVRKENELLRIEYEQNVAANEQTGPINKEMRSLITTLQTNNKLLKSENLRSKKWLEDSNQELEKIKKQLAYYHQHKGESVKNSERLPVKNEPATQGDVAFDVKSEVDPVKSESKQEKEIKQLKEHNQKLIEDQKDLKNLLEIYSKSNKQQLQSPNVLNAQNNSKHKIVELDEAKLEIKRLKESLDKYKSSSNKIIIPSQHILSQSNDHSTQNHHHHNDESNSNNNSNPTQSTINQYNGQISDLNKKIKTLEETIRELHKNLGSKKQEENALLNDMEITGQAYEETQEQNVRLMQQLREKDDANFKLVSERIKLENVQKILKEEKEIYVQQVVTLQEQLETQMCISKKLEEQFLLANQSMMLSDKDLNQWQHSCENYRRQTIDQVHVNQELRLNSHTYLNQLKEAQKNLAEKSELLATQSFQNKRSQEEIKHLHTKIERQKKFEMASNMDEVLMEEIKEYKEQLRCPSCKVKQKDAVLTKCFHVFCFDCLQKRYDTRQRKCPKCNANFGANDFRKLYLS